MTDAPDLTELPIDELIQQMHDDLYDGMAEEVEAEVHELLRRGWTPYEALTKGLVGGMDIGSLLRCIRGEHFGRIGRITALPAPLQELASESHARVLEADLEGVGRVLLPRANVELIEA